jgi:hypothetical protein
VRKSQDDGEDARRVGVVPPVGGNPQTVDGHGAGVAPGAEIIDPEEHRVPLAVEHRDDLLLLVQAEQLHGRKSLQTRAQAGLLMRAAEVSGGPVAVHANEPTAGIHGLAHAGVVGTVGGLEQGAKEKRIRTT